ncbi:MAG: SH3 domain-containing protein [Spirochaetaceae bacterium]|jgi:hypothetical protein|nr:SH3 domain-containing protein [Spirochaetaceae bacterium]
MRAYFFILAGWLALGLASCEDKLLGWGILLWGTEEPAIPSGTILPIYVKSNINRHWIAGIPEAYRAQSDGTERPIDKFEIPLAKLELVGSKGATQKRAEAFAELALVYAETLQDGLPIRADPDNSARRVYRLRQGEVVKILASAGGNPPISATGEPLDGSWYKVLTEDGAEGYCFSYRLRLFEHPGGVLSIVHLEEEQTDPDLDKLLSKIWSPESYGNMVNAGALDLEELSRHWRFSPGQDTGIAHIFTPAVNRTFPYTGIRSDGTRAWRFEGAHLQMRLRSDTTLEVQFTDNSGALRTLLFVALSSDVDDLIIQETARQETLFKRIYDLGPGFNSANYGSLSFTSEGGFSWTGYDFLVPQVIPGPGMGKGTVSMGLFLDSALARTNRYDGAISFHLERLTAPISFLYAMDSQGLRIEYIPPVNIEGSLVTRPASSPLVIYFFKADSL